MTDVKSLPVDQNGQLYGDGVWIPETQHDHPETLTPPTDVVLQREPVALETIPVRVDGPVEVRELPATQPAYRTFILDTIAAVRVLDANPRRKGAILIVADKAGASRGVALGFRQSQAQENIGFNIPLYGPATATSAFVHAPFPVNHRGEVWAIACGTTCNVSVSEEMWTG